MVNATLAMRNRVWRYLYNKPEMTQSQIGLATGTTGTIKEILDELVRFGAVERLGYRSRGVKYKLIKKDWGEIICKE